jgi:hypothetical protein
MRRIRKLIAALSGRACPRTLAGGRRRATTPPTATGGASRKPLQTSVCTLTAAKRRLLRLTLLAPDIIEPFMAGKQPRRLTLMWFQRIRLMVDWHAQRQLMSSSEEDM